jgi:hypothetical protein
MVVTFEPDPPALLMRPLGLCVLGILGDGGVVTD